MIRNFKRWLIVAVIVIVASGLALTLLSVQQEDSLQRADLLTKTHLLQADINTAYVKDLTGSESDLESPYYQILKNQLIKTRSEDPEIRFVYLMGQRSDGTVFFYVDSEPPESSDYSPPGEVYSEASATLLNSFSSGKETTEGPTTDRWGTWVSSIVPITDPTSGKVIAVLGADINARNWNIEIVKASTPSIIVTLLLVFFLLIFVYFQQRNEREKQILTASEAAIRESESRYRTIFENTGTAMLIIEEDNTISFANKEFFRLTGISQEDIDKGRSWAEFIFKDDLEKMIQQRKLRLEKPETVPKQYEFRLITKSGEIRNILLTADMLPGTKRSVASLIDITENKITEAELEHYASELTTYADTLRKTNDKLNLLNSITRHDILNQLTAILGYLEIMQMSYPDSTLQEYINKETQAARNIRTQITFTKDYQDIGAQSPQWFDIRKVIGLAAADLPLSEISVLVKCDNLELYADPLLEKVFYTLFENTLRHGKTVTAIEISCKTQDDQLILIYQDNGEGIPAEYKEAIFERKFFKHTGFGLFLARTILDSTGMTIQETGEPGKGAKFEIIVPTGAYRFTNVS